MNSLSWLLYLGSLSEGVAGFLGVSAALLIIAVGGTGFCSLMEDGRPTPLDGKRWRIFGVALCMLFVAFLMPSAKTVYLIAASEAGETVATSEEGREMLKLLRERIKRELAPKEAK